MYFYDQKQSYRYNYHQLASVGQKQHIKISNKKLPLPHFNNLFQYRIVEVAVFEKLGNQCFHGVVHVELLLGLFQAELASSQKSDDELVGRSAYDVRLLLEPVSDGLNVGLASLGVLADILDRLLQQVRR